MKVQFTEFDGCFAIDLAAENMQEAAQLVRFGVNRTNEIRTARTYVTNDGSFDASIIFGKSKKANSDVPKRP